jgi:hypothetical protein
MFISIAVSMVIRLIAEDLEVAPFFFAVNMSLICLFLVAFWRQSKSKIVKYRFDTLEVVYDPILQLDQFHLQRTTSLGWYSHWWFKIIQTILIDHMLFCLAFNYTGRFQGTPKLSREFFDCFRHRNEENACTDLMIWAFARGFLVFVAGMYSLVTLYLVLSPANDAHAEDSIVVDRNRNRFTFPTSKRDGLILEGVSRVTFPGRNQIPANMALGMLPANGLPANAQNYVQPDFLLVSLSDDYSWYKRWILRWSPMVTYYIIDFALYSEMMVQTVIGPEHNLKEVFERAAKKVAQVRGISYDKMNWTAGLDVPLETFTVFKLMLAKYRGEREFPLN